MPGVIVPAEAWEAGGTVAVNTPSWTDLELSVPDLGDKGSVVVCKVEVDPVLVDLRHVYDPVGVVGVAVQVVVHRP